jgi:UDP-N-acetylmuramyl tripeptide synthase
MTITIGRADQRRETADRFTLDPRHPLGSGGAHRWLRSRVHADPRAVHLAPTTTSVTDDRTPSTRPAGGSTDHLGLRAKAAIAAGKGVAGVSRIANLGSGSVIGGRVSLALDGDLLGSLVGGRDVALISATNGKTTTTHLLATALARHGPVVSNSLGANMPAGIVAALADADAAARAVLEVDERYLDTLLRHTDHATVLLLNLSRDQLDRSHEVRKIADDWRESLGRRSTERVVANADDPLVVWAASSAPTIVWVGTAAHWTNDASGCPSCGGRIEFVDADERGVTSWRCLDCAFAKPEPEWWLEVEPGDAEHPDTHVLVRADGSRRPLELALPGRVNAANAAMVLAAADAMGADLDRAARALATVTDVAGRYRTATVAGAQLRMLLAKNPAGWQEAIAMLAPSPQPVVASINARIADGRDPSWLWDVPFEHLQGRFVVALGERRHDLAVRLQYAEVDHAVAESLTEGVRLAADRSETGAVDLIANYTAFQDYRVEVEE